jgi:hypothetical protein
MFKGHSEHAWNQTALLAYLTAEPNRDSKRRPTPYHPDDFNPHAQGRVHKGTIKATPRLLAEIFCNGPRQ